MARIFEGVRASPFSVKGELRDSSALSFRLEICSSVPKVYLKLTNGADVRNIMLGKDAQMASVGASSAIVSSQAQSYILHFTTPKDVKTFLTSLKDIMNPNSQSIFEQRTDSTSAEQYFQFYGYLSQQQNMMQDYIRTSTYQRAMLENSADFIDKVVLDVGAGSGILSFFAIQAGAAKVYAVEASNMAAHCETLVRTNRLQDRITVLAGKIEEVQLPEMVDIIISEPMGYMLLNERMLETYLHAKKWLKPGGKMFPTQGDLYMAPFTDDALYMEQFSKANFWCQPCFHGVDLSSIRHAAVMEYFKQPIVDTFDVRICTAAPLKHVIDFSVAHETDLHDIKMPLTFNVQQSGTIHGIAFWFEVAFLGSQNSVILSTAPTQPLTHWYQVRCLLETPIFARQGQVLEGKVHLRANTRQSYDVDIELGIVGSGVVSSNTLDLKNPFFRYTGQQPLPPPGTNNASPTELYWAQQEAATAQQMQVANGYYVNGGAVGYVDNTQQQQVAAAQPLLPAAPPSMAAPVNPGSIPAATLSSQSAASQALHSRTSIGGGLSPTVFGQTSAVSTIAGLQYPISTVAGVQYPISSQFMIGDYVNLFTGTGGADQVIAPQQTTFKTAAGGLH